jgi:hypothetical protein
MGKRQFLVIGLREEFEAQISSKRYLKIQFLLHRKRAASSLWRKEWLKQFNEILIVYFENNMKHTVARIQSFLMLKPVIHIVTP